MTLHLPSILFALRQHKAHLAIAMLGAALTMAVVANALHVVVPKWQGLRAGSGMDEGRVVLVQAHDVGAQAHRGSRMQQALATFAAQPGVASVANVGAMAFVNDFTLSVTASSGVRSNVGVYYGSPTFTETLGLRVIAGNGFEDTDFVPFDGGAGLDRVNAVLITRDLAAALFGVAPAVGQRLQVGTQHDVTIKGVVDDVLRPRPSMRDPIANRRVVIAPIVPEGPAAAFVIRTDDAFSADRLVHDAQAALRRDGDWTIERAATLRQVRDDFFDHESAVVHALLSGSLILAAVTLLGLVGLSHAWVAQRRASIGIRRAVGATRASVVGSFLVESTLVMGIAACVGAFSALALGRLLTERYGVEMLTSGTIGLSAACLLLLGWIAVLGPALAASRVSPREAMEG